MAAIIVVFFIILERQVVVLLGGIFDTLVVKLFKGTNHTETGVAWFDDIVDVTLVGGIVWIAEELLVLGLLLLDNLLLGLGGVGCFEFLPIEHLHSTTGTHHCNFGRGPSVVDITAKLLAAHHDVGTTIAFAECDSYLGNGRFAVGIEQLGTMVDDTIILLSRAGKEAWYVDEGDKRNVEGIAETHETGCLA